MPRPKLLKIVVSALVEHGGHGSSAAAPLVQQMPGEKGIQMYRSLKLDQGLKRVPVIVVSSIDRRAFAVYRKSHNLWEDPAGPPRGAFLEKPLEAD